MLRWDSASGVGVVAIPHNDDSWPDKNREHAEEIMKQTCPHGYQILYEHDAVVGEVVDRSVQRVGYVRIRETSVHPQTEYQITFRSNDAPPGLVAPPPLSAPAPVVVPTRMVAPMASPPAAVVTPPQSSPDLPPAPIPQ